MAGSSARVRPAAPLVALLSILSICLFGGAIPLPAFAASARVQYLSATNVYVDAGSAEGLTDGAGLVVRRGGKEVARLTVVYVAEHSASCRIEPSAEPVRVGDLCSFTPAALPDSAGSRPSSVASPPGYAKSGAWNDSSPVSSDRAWSQTRHMTGRVMTFYTRSSDRVGSYENPSVLGDLRWGGPLQEEISLRVFATRPSSRAVTDLPGVTFTESRTRIYEVAARYRNPDGRLEAAGGRFLAPRLEGLGYLDGGGVSWRARPSLAVGVAGGTGSDLGVAGLGSRGIRAGGWIEAGTPTSSAERRWRALLSGGFQADSSLTRREYAAERLDFWPQRNRVVYQSAEIDYNPAWKRALGERAIVLTAWSIGGSFQIQPRLWTTLAFDSRRPLLSPEQRLVPAVIALDRYSGLHASSRFDLSRDQSVWIGGAVRRRDRDGKTYKSWDLGLNSRRILDDSFSGGIHAFGYDDGPAQGINADTNLAARLRSWGTFEVSGGFGAVLGDASASAIPEYRSRWIRAGLDLHGPQGTWIRVAHEWQGGGTGNELTAEAGLAF